MLQMAAQDTSPEGLRLSLIVEMLYGGGLRVSELAGMRLAAVAGRGEFIRVTGKGQNERLSPLSPAARLALDWQAPAPLIGRIIQTIIRMTRQGATWPLRLLGLAYQAGPTRRRGLPAPRRTHPSC